MFEEKFLNCFVGETSSSESRVYVEYTGEVSDDHTIEISGHVIGPISDLTSTLPATIPIRDSKNPLHPLAEAIVPHPCSWTMETALLYGVEIRVKYNDADFHVKKLIGIRPLGILEQEIIWDYKPWYVEAIRSDHASDEYLKWLVENKFSLVVSKLEEDLLLKASTFGASILWAPESGSISEDELRQFACFPSLMMIVLSTATSPHSMQRYRKIAKNVLFAADGKVNHQAANQFDLIVCNQTDEADSQGLPHLVWIQDDYLESQDEVKNRFDHWYHELRDSKPVGVILQPASAIV